MATLEMRSTVSTSLAWFYSWPRLDWLEMHCSVWSNKSLQRSVCKRLKRFAVGFPLTLLGEDANDWIEHYVYWGTAVVMRTRLLLL